MQINLQKSDVPIIWLDTFFVIEYGKIVLGNSNDKRYKSLYDILIKNIHQGKILCARAEQENELEGDIDVCMKHFLALTREVRFKSSYEIDKIQSIRMMNTYHKRLREFDVLQSDVQMVRKITNENLIINVYSKPTEASLKNMKAEKMSNLKELQDFKDAQSLEVTFDEILENEYKGIYLATLEMLREAENIQKMVYGKIDFDLKLYNQFIGLVIEPLQDWDHVTNKVNDLNGYIKFLLSEEHKEIPYIDISAHLTADIMASTKKWDSGDSKDISNLSSYLPYCNYILTDLAQHNRIKRLGLDKKYNTKVFCMKNIEDLIEVIC